MNPRVVRSAAAVILLALFACAAQATRAQDAGLPSTSPTAVQGTPPAQAEPAAEIDAAAITFSEYPLNTAITTQYAGRGIVFGGDSPFITTDSANPTSPVLSGSPLFRGNIEGRFVDPADGRTPVAVASFTLDIGYFDELLSTQIEWFDPNGRRLGLRTNTMLGIQRFTIEGGNIASWRIAIIKTEPAGYAIDNLSFAPIQSSVLFREVTGADKTLTWLDLPGFDHVGLNFDNRVYEAHPGYRDAGQPDGAYNLFYSADGRESANVQVIPGVQAQHTKGTFKYDKLPSRGASPVIRFEEIPIGSDLAAQMLTLIQGQIAAHAGFQDVNVANYLNLLPAGQKGAGGKFTPVGLLEWAAEQAGYKGGQGFIRSEFEAITRLILPSLTVDVVPLLSPELLNWSMKSGNAWDGSNQWLQGFFGPMDFMITDPLGRRLGYTAALGAHNEIPYAFYSGDGPFEQFLIPNLVPGAYQILYVGAGGQAFGAVVSRFGGDSLQGELGAGEVLTTTVTVDAQAGVAGDVNADSCIDQADALQLAGRLNTFPAGLADPADLDGSGIIEQADLDLLRRLILTNVPCAHVFAPYVSSSVPVVPPPPVCRSGTYTPVDVMFALDRSESFATQNRIGRSKVAIIAFMDKVAGTGEQVALTKFSKVVELAQPLTTDRQAVYNLLVDVPAQEGTAIGDAIAVAARELLGPRHIPGHRPVLIVFSDGENTDGSDPLQQAKAAKARGIRIFTVSSWENVDKDLLKQIASSSRDFYYTAGTHDMAASAQAIADRVRCGD